MTDDQLVEHRLKQLEGLAVGFRQAERRTDLLEVSVSRFETQQAELRAEVRERDEHTRASLARLHSRFDELAADEQREQGASAARTQIWRVVAATIGALAAITGIVVGVATVFFL